MGCTPPWPAPHVPSCPTVRVMCEFGIPRSPVAFLPGRQPRQPTPKSIQDQFTKTTRDETATHLANADRNRQVLQVLVKSDHEPRVHRRYEVVQHPVVLVQHDLRMIS